MGTKISEQTEQPLSQLRDIVEFPIRYGASPIGRKVSLDSLTFNSYKLCVFASGSSYIVRDGDTGLTKYSSSSGAAAIQWALDNLTAARTWKESVLLAGTIAVETKVVVPSYCRIHVNGSLVVTGTNEIFECVGVSDVDFYGGTYSMPAAGTTVTQHAISLDAVTRARIRDLDVNGGGGHAINILNGSAYIEVTGSHISSPGDDGISIVESNNIRIIGNTCHDGRSASGGSTGIEIENNSHTITIQGNACYNNERGIQTVVDSGAAFDGCYDISIVGNHCYNNTSAGILCQYNGTTGVQARNHTVIGNVCRSNGLGISLNKCDESGFFGNVIEETTSPDGQGLLIDQCDNLAISANIVSECRGNGIEYVGQHCRIFANNIRNCGKDGNLNENYGIRLKTTHFYVKCIGNYLVDTQGTPTMSGINTFDGDTVEIRNNHFSNLANNPGPGTNAIYEQSANGPILMQDNTNDVGDAVTFVTEAEGQISGTSPINVAHGIESATASDVVVLVTPMEAGVTDFFASLTSTNLTITFSGGGTRLFAYSVRSKRE